MRDFFSISNENKVLTLINENESAKLEEKIEYVRIAVHALFNTVNGFVWKAKVVSKVEHSTLLPVASKHFKLYFYLLKVPDELNN